MTVRLGKISIKFGFSKSQSGTWEYTTTKSEVHYVRFGIIQSYHKLDENAQGSVIAFLLGRWAFRIAIF